MSHGAASDDGDGPQRSAADAAGSAMSGGFNDNHRRRLQAAFQQLVKAFGEVEGLLDEDAPAVRDGLYTEDLETAERSLLRDDLACLRQAVADGLRAMGLEPSPPRCGLSWAVRSQLVSLADALAELEPQRMRRYGGLSDDAAERLRNVLDELRRRLDAASRRLSDGAA
jgi:hypothetical protein